MTLLGHFHPGPVIPANGDLCIPPRWSARGTLLHSSLTGEDQFWVPWTHKRSATPSPGVAMGQAYPQLNLEAWWTLARLQAQGSSPSGPLARRPRRSPRPAPSCGAPCPPGARPAPSTPAPSLPAITNSLYWDWRRSAVPPMLRDRKAGSKPPAGGCAAGCRARPPARRWRTPGLRNGCSYTRIRPARVWTASPPRKSSSAQRCTSKVDGRETP